MADQPRDREGAGGGWLPPERSRPAPPADAPPPFGPAAGPRSPAGPATDRPTSPPATRSPQPYAHPLAAPHAAQDAGNGEATAALVLGIVAVVLVVPLGFFLITLPIALICAVIAIVLGRAGRRKVDRGATTRHRGQAQAGFVMGVVGALLAVLAIAGFVLLISFSEQFQRDFKRGFERQQQLQSGRPSVAAPPLVRVE